MRHLCEGDSYSFNNSNIKFDSNPYRFNVHIEKISPNNKKTEYLTV